MTDAGTGTGANASTLYSMLVVVIPLQSILLLERLLTITTERLIDVDSVTTKTITRWRRLLLLLLLLQSLRTIRDNNKRFDWERSLHAEAVVVVVVVMGE